MRSHASTPVRLFWFSAAALLALAVVVTVQLTIAPEEADPAAPVPVCAEADVPEPITERVTCRTASATLTIAGEGHPVVLEDTEARVLRSRIERRILSVSIRVRRHTGTYLRRGAVRRQVYARVGDVRRWPLPGRRSEGTMQLRFELPRETARRLRRGRVAAELGIVAWDELGEQHPERLGVIRLAPRS